MRSFNLKPIEPITSGVNTQPQSPLTQGSYGNTYTNYLTKAMLNFNNEALQTLNKADASVAAAAGKPMNSDLSLKNEDLNKDGKIGDGVNVPSIDDPEKLKNDNINKAFNLASRVLAAGIRDGFKKWGNKHSAREIISIARPHSYQGGGGLLKQPALTGVSVPTATIPLSSIPGNVLPIAMNEKLRKKTERKARALLAGKSFKLMAINNMDAIRESLEKGRLGVLEANSAEGARSAVFREKIKNNRPEKSIWDNNPNDPLNIKSAAAAFNRGGRLSILQELLK